MARLVTNPRVLEEGFVPDDVEYLDAEREAISIAVEPARYGDRPESVLLSGPRGSGKTCLSHIALAHVQKTGAEVTTVYLDCRGVSSRFDALCEILTGIGAPTFDLHQRSTPHTEILARLEEHVTAPCLIVLDEIGRLPDIELLYSLLRIPEVSLLTATSHSEEVFEALDKRVQSRLKAGFQIQMERYTDDEITAIIEERVQQGLVDGAISPRQIEVVVEEVAGDAGHGIRALRTAVRTAEEQDMNSVPDDALHHAIRQTEAGVRETALDSLSPDQEVLYSLIEDADGIAPGVLYERYQAAVETPKSRRMVRKYLAWMADENLIRRTGKTRERMYHAMPRPVLQESR